jgi:ribonucleoside-diphosphate reductase alpha chain
LQHGVPLETYVQKFTNLKFEPGRSDRRPGRPDGAVDHGLHLPPPGPGLPAVRRPAGLGIYSADERSRQLDTGSYEPAPVEVSEAESLKSVEPAAETADKPVVAEAAAAKPLDTSEVRTTAEMFELITGTSVDAPLCFTCGTKMRPSGSCYVCEGCGAPPAAADHRHELDSAAAPGTSHHSPGP